MKPLIIFVLLGLATSLPAAAQEWALGGYDPVAFLRSGKPVPGRSNIATMWKGKFWHFSTEDNRARFEADPRAFTPGFGGYCPVSLAEGRKEPGDPRHFVIVGNKLYLTRSISNERRFLAAPEDILSKARAAWVRMR